jgi:predicted enzyme related to lactoylglutathione lyase
VLVWTGLIHRGLGDVERTREHIEEAWRLAGGDAVGEGPLDVHAAVPAHTGMSGYLMLIGENARAVEIGERGLAIADRTGDVAWAIYRLLPFVIENALYLEDYQRAKRFYGETLGMPVEDYPGEPSGGAVMAGDGTIIELYERPGVPAPPNTVAGFHAVDFDDTIAELRERGITFEDYDIPEIGLKTIDGVAERAGAKTAWFKDSEGNILAIDTM